MLLVREKGKTDKRAVLEILRELIDPGVPMNLEEMGIISYEWIHVHDDVVQVEFRPTSHVCPVGLAIGVVIKDALERGLGTDVEVRMRRGSHLQEGLVNDLLHDRERYSKALERLRGSGFVRRCHK